MVAAGDVRARVAWLRFVCFWDDVGRVFALRVCQRLRAGVAAGWVLMLRSVLGVCAVCDGLKRAFYVKNWRDLR